MNVLPSAEVKVEATPRRIALFVQGIAAMQPDRELGDLGPLLREMSMRLAGKSDAGASRVSSKASRPTEKDIEDPGDAQREIHLPEEKEKGQAVAALLPDLIKGLLASLSFPKLMRWRSFRVPFPASHPVAGCSDGCQKDTRCRLRM